MKKLIQIFAYIGTASMVAAPWSGDMMIPALILGLTFLLPQAIDVKAWNLVLLNLSGIAGYIWRLF